MHDCTLMNSIRCIDCPYRNDCYNDYNSKIKYGRMIVKLKWCFRKLRSKLFKYLLYPTLSLFGDPLGFKRYDKMFRKAINNSHDTIELDWAINNVLDNYIKWLKEHNIKVIYSYTVYGNGISLIDVRCYKFYNFFNVKFNIDEMYETKWHFINRTWSLGRTSSPLDYVIRHYKKESK